MTYASISRATSSALAYRADRSRCSARSATAASSGGASCKTERTRGGASLITFSITEYADPPSNGGRPVRISNRIAPRLHTSLRSSISSSFPAACSGLMYDGVPSACPAIVASARIASVSRRSCFPFTSFSPRALARPQSSTTVSPNCPTITLSGLRSRCTTPRLWAYATAWQMSAKNVCMTHISSFFCAAIPATRKAMNWFA